MATAAKEKSTKRSGLKLDDADALSGLLNTPEKQGGPLEIDLNLIDPDPNQPRKPGNPGLTKASLNELAATIKLRKVKSPISVRENLDKPGRYLINHGERRWRASEIAGMNTIPAFIDNDYNEADQVVENLQRNELTAREIADYIGRELAKGEKKGNIARALGKSNAFITQHVTLLDLPEPIADAFNTGRLSDVTTINELVTAFKKHPDEVEILLETTDEVTRSVAKEFREHLKHKEDLATAPSPMPGGGQAGALDSPGAEERQEEESPESNSGSKDGERETQESLDYGSTDKLTREKVKVSVMVTVGKRLGKLLLNRGTPYSGGAWVEYTDNGEITGVDISELSICELKTGS